MKLVTLRDLFNSEIICDISNIKAIIFGSKLEGKMPDCTVFFDIIVNNCSMNCNCSIEEGRRLVEQLTNHYIEH